MRACRSAIAVSLTLGVLALPGSATAKGAAREKPKTFMESCKADREKFCHDVVLGHGRLLLCLREHQQDLEPECLRFFLGDNEPTKL